MLRLTLAVTLLLAAPALAQDLPAIRPGTPYAAARGSLLAAGWQPHRLPDADACDPADERCAGRPEMHACSGTGVGACSFTWRRAATIIAVTTRGEVGPTVTGVSLRAAAPASADAKPAVLPGTWASLDGVWTTGSPVPCPSPNTITLTPTELRFVDAKGAVDAERVVTLRADALETVSASSPTSPSGTRWRYTLLDFNTMRSLHVARGVGATWRRCR